MAGWWHGRGFGQAGSSSWVRPGARRQFRLREKRRSWGGGIEIVLRGGRRWADIRAYILRFLEKPQVGMIIPELQREAEKGPALPGCCQSRGWSDTLTPPLPLKPELGASGPRTISPLVGVGMEVRGWAALETEAGVLCSAPSLSCFSEPCVYLPTTAIPDWGGKSFTFMLRVQIPYAFCIYDISMFVLKLGKVYNDLLITKIIDLPVMKAMTLSLCWFLSVRRGEGSRPCGMGPGGDVIVCGP